MATLAEAECKLLPQAGCEHGPEPCRRAAQPTQAPEPVTPGGASSVGELRVGVADVTSSPDWVDWPWMVCKWNGGDLSRVAGKVACEVKQDEGSIKGQHSHSSLGTNSH